MSDLFYEYVKEEKTFEELKNAIGEEKYNQLVSFVREKYNDFFSFSKVIVESAQDLKKIFENCVVVFDKESFEKFEKKYGENVVSNVVITFNRAVDFCVVNRFSKNEFKIILMKYYDCPLIVADDIATTFEQNRLYFMISKLLPKKNN